MSTRGPTSPNIPMEVLPGEATWQLVDVKEMSKNGAQFVRGCGARKMFASATSPQRLRRHVCSRRR